MPDARTEREKLVEETRKPWRNRCAHGMSRVARCSDVVSYPVYWCSGCLLRALVTDLLTEEGDPEAWMAEADWGDGRGFVRPRRFHLSRRAAWTDLNLNARKAVERRVVPLYPGPAQEASGE